MQVVFVTGNTTKFDSACKELEPYNILLVHHRIDIEEIQSDSFEYIAKHKAESAYKLIKRPLIVNDSGWLIPGLNGFPGPYMKFINQWFTPEDFIALMAIHENREIILRETVVYIDAKIKKTFTHDYKGIILPEPRGVVGHSCDKVISLNPNGLSIAEEKEKTNRHSEFENAIWHEFARWFISDSRNNNKDI